MMRKKIVLKLGWCIRLEF